MSKVNNKAIRIVSIDVTITFFIDSEQVLGLLLRSFPSFFIELGRKFYPQEDLY